MLLLAVLSSDAIFPLFLLHYVYPCPHKTPVISDHSAFLINTFFNCGPLNIFIGRERQLCTFFYCCYSVWVQLEKFFAFPFNTSCLCLIPAKYKFEKFQGKSFWGVSWELFHLFLKDVHSPARGPNKHCGLLVGLHLITRLLQLVSRRCALLWS